MRTYAFCLALAGLAALTPLASAAADSTHIEMGRLASAATSSQPSATTWLERVNEVRVASGLNPVTANEEWAEGIRLHLKYMKETPASLITGAYANLHTENPASPWYTEAGAAAAGSSNLGGGSDPIKAIDSWLTAPFHALGILRPWLTQMAWATDGQSSGLDVIRGTRVTTPPPPGPIGAPTPEPPAPPVPIVFPGSGSTTYLAGFRGESPDPIETCQAQHPDADYERDPALPVIVQLRSTTPAGLVASHTRPDGITDLSSDPDLCLVSADTFYSTDTVYGPTGKSLLLGGNVFIIARRHLAPGDHTFRLTAPGMADVAWTFRVDYPVKAPEISTRTTCSASAVPTGEVSVTMRHPGTNPYSQDIQVTVGDKSESWPASYPGSIESWTVSDLPAGTIPIAATGSDGPRTDTTATVTTCPTWRVAKATVRRRGPHLQVSADNRLNATAVRFQVISAKRTLRRVLVSPRSTKILKPIHLRPGQRVVVVKADGHVIFRGRG